MDLSRREFGGMTLAALLLAACGSSEDSNANSEVDIADPGGSTVPPNDEPLTLPLRDTSGGDPVIAGAAITAMAHRLFGASRDANAGVNLTVSPASIAMAFAMLELGSSGEATNQLREMLAISDPDAYHAAMGALEVALETERDGLTFSLANAAYLQHGYPFAGDYLDAIGTNYGPALTEVDFADSGPVTDQINGWVEEQTEGFIPDLIPDGFINGMTRLVLVNALYLLATWQDAFDPDFTESGLFTLADGSTLEVDMMRGWNTGAWRTAGAVVGEKTYDGGLVAQFVLPDDGEFDAVATRLGEIFDGRPDGLIRGDLVLPRFETRSEVDLAPIVQALGVIAPFSTGNLMRIANDPQLFVSGAVHQTYVSFDEKGTEAAAATAIGVRTTSAGPEPVNVILDRPFFYRIVDTATDATIFIGQVLDPTAG